jgi:hypothetical protein
MATTLSEALPVTTARTAKDVDDSVTQSHRTPSDMGWLPSIAMSLVSPSNTPSCPSPELALNGGFSVEKSPQLAEVSPDPSHASA